MWTPNFKCQTVQMVTALPTEKQLCRVLLCYQKSKPFCCLHCLEDNCLPLNLLILPTLTFSATHMLLPKLFYNSKIQSDRVLLDHEIMISVFWSSNHDWSYNILYWSFVRNGSSKDKKVRRKWPYIMTISSSSDTQEGFIYHDYVDDHYGHRVGITWRCCQAIQLFRFLNA